MFKRYLLIISFISFFVLGATILVTTLNEKKRFPNKEFHTFKEKTELRKKIKEPHIMSPIKAGEFFLHSDNCRTCHGHDSVSYSNIDAAGNDINLVYDWESTMMANSAKDPLWRAKVSHEILVNPSHANELQDKCTSCHAPQGHFTAHFKGSAFYTMDDLKNDTLGLDGVACLSCHTIGASGLGNQFSGNIPYDTTRKIFGPYLNPNAGPMQLYVGFTPTYSAHMGESRACSPCHTLIINTADMLGAATGKTFVEQALYHEYLNSSFSQDNVTCQNCHMPQVFDSVIIANGYLNLPPRSPFNRHKFQGGNSFMIELIKNNKDKLGIKVSNARFDSSIAITKRNLRFNSVDLNLFQDSITADTAFYRVRLSNLVGHKFPSGYPSRRAVLQFVIVGLANDTLFKSGLIGADGEVIGVGLPYENHYNIINSENQNQIYEMVLGDVNGNKTTVLERADTSLKDNRLVPEGFLSTSSVYDTVKICGGAENDPDFNKFSGGIEGSGKDFVHFRIPIAGFPSVYNVYSRLYYQALPPAWLQEMFSYSSADIDSFRTMYNSANKSPVLVDADSILNVLLGLTKNNNKTEVTVSPDPTLDGYALVRFSKLTEVGMVRIIDMNAQLVETVRVGRQVDQIPIQLPEQKGVYLIEIYIDDYRISRKLIRQ